MQNHEITADIAGEAAVPENKMGTMPMPKLLLTMSLPAICSMMLQAVYNIVDSFFVSRISEDAMAAVTLVFPVQMLIIAAGVGTGVGLNSLISRRLGAKRFADADSAATHGFLLVLVNWAVFFLFGFFCSRPFYTWYADDNIGLVDMATSYGTIVLCFSCFIFMQTTCEKILQATGKMVIPMVSNMIGCVVNIVLDPIMIFGLFGCPAMGVTGAAAATIIGQCVGMSVILVCFFKTKCDVHVSFRNFQFSMKTIKEIYTVALPGMIMQAIPSFVNMFLNMILIGFSVTAVSVLGVYFRLQSFIFMPTFGLTQGAMPIMGYNYGARNRKRLMSATVLCLISAAVIMVFGLIVFQTCPHQLMAMFDAGEEMMNMGVSAMRLLSLCFIPAAVGITFSTFFQALGHGIYSLFMTLIRQCIGIMPAAWVFSKMWGVIGVWISFPVAEFFGLIVAILFFVIVYKKEIKTM